MEERREFQRSTFHLKTELILEAERRTISLLRTNISFGGIGGYTRDLVKTGDAVLVRIYFSQRSGEEKAETVSGNIAWCKQDGNFVALGIRFKTLHSDEHPLLISYLQYADQFD